MKKIALKLIDYGFDFEYQNHHINGEKITIPFLDIEIYTHRGQIFYERKGKAKILEETERNYEVIIIKLERRLVTKTSLFKI